MKNSLWRAVSLFSIILVSAAFAFMGCNKKDSSVDPSDREQQESETGKILYEGVLDGIHQFDFST